MTSKNQMDYNNEDETRSNIGISGLSELNDIRSELENINSNENSNNVNENSKSSSSFNSSYSHGQNVSPNNPSNTNSQVTTSHPPWFKYLPPPPQKHGIFSSHLKAQRKSVIIKSCANILIMGILILAILSIYWGSYFKRETRVKNLNLWFIDRDGSGIDLPDGINPIVGPALRQAALNAVQDTWTPSVEVVNYNGTLEELYLDIRNEKCWGAFYVGENATLSLINAINGRSVENYNSSEFAQFAYFESRQETAIDTYIWPWVLELKNSFSTSFALNFSKFIIQQYGVEAFTNISVNSTELIISPVALNIHNLHPMVYELALASLTVGLIFLIIVSFFQINFFMPINGPLAPITKPFQYALYRYFMLWSSYFFISLFYSLVPLAMQLPFTNTYGKGGFVIFWMYNWLGMVALGGASENAATIAFAFFPPLIGFWLIMWVILQASTSFSPLALSPEVFRVGYALPVMQVMVVVRHILFDTANHMGRSAYVLISFIAINHSLLPFSLKIAAWKMKKNAIAAAKAKYEKELKEKENI